MKKKNKKKGTNVRNKFISEIDKNTLGIIDEYTISPVDTHTYCGDPSIGDFSKFIST
jgi:hypothetical protein